MNYPIVDIGSNTIRLSVYHIFDENGFEVLFAEKEMAGLVNYIQDEIMSQSGIDKACRVLLAYKNTLEKLNMGDMYAFATASLRNIKNSSEVLAEIKEKTGIEIDLVSGSLEGELGCLGILKEIGLKNGVMVDIGGGSTEVVEISEGNLTESVSFPIGSLNTFRKCVSSILPTEDEVKKIKKHIKKEIKLSHISNPETVCVVGGTARSVLEIVNLHFKKNPENRVVTLKELGKVCDLLVKGDNYSKDLIIKTSPDRLHTITTGAMIMEYVFKKIKCDNIYVGQYGVREGYLCKKLK